ncbi:MAG: MarR family transcriptional regulator [Methanosphaera sp.]|nr:MarR family transcriptional regulator [Methanosphaera sp.]
MEKFDASIKKNMKEFSLNFILETLTRQHDIYLKDKLKPYNIGVSEFYFILRLNLIGKSNQHNMAEFFLLSEGTIAKTTRKLEEKKLIIREIDPNNRRQNYISLTPRGIKIANNILNLDQEWQKEICDELTNDEINQLNRLLLKISYRAIEERNKIDNIN